MGLLVAYIIIVVSTIFGAAVLCVFIGPSDITVHQFGLVLSAVFLDHLAIVVALGQTDRA